NPRVVLVCAANAVLSQYHWKVRGVQAAATTLKLALPPTVVVWLCGWSTMAGGVCSCTTIWLVESEALPEASVTVMTTTLVPRGRTALLVGTWARVRLPDKSVATR